MRQRVRTRGPEGADLCGDPPPGRLVEQRGAANPPIVALSHATTACDGGTPRTVSATSLRSRWSAARRPRAPRRRRFGRDSNRRWRGKRSSRTPRSTPAPMICRDDPEERDGMGCQHRGKTNLIGEAAEWRRGSHCAAQRSRARCRATREARFLLRARKTQIFNGQNKWEERTCRYERIINCYRCLRKCLHYRLF